MSRRTTSARVGWIDRVKATARRPTIACRRAATGSDAQGPARCEAVEPRTLFSSADIYLPPPVALAASDVQTILAQAVSQARPGQVAAVVDREGTVLGILARGGGASAEQTDIATLAVQRARTAAAFESSQNAFTTRTARFIIQDHFPFPVTRTPGGPLYGVEFSSFPGSDVLLADHQSGISGDPGGVPLYLDGVPVGGIGVAGDGSDRSPRASLRQTLIDLRGAYGSRSVKQAFTGREESDFDESVAIAGTTGYAAPKNIRATHVFVEGLRFPFTNSPRAKGQPSQSFDQLAAGTATALSLPTAGKADPSIVAGTPRLTNGTVAGVPGLFRNRLDAGATAPQESERTAINALIDSDDVDAVRLTSADVANVIENAVKQATVLRAGIREPDGVRAQVHVVVVDRDGDVLGVFRMADGTNFSYDVAVQKARTAAFFSDDTHAISTRALGFVSQKYFPAGIDSGVGGPLYQLQDKISVTDVAGTISLNLPKLSATPNGITVFPGGEPLYKDGVFVGAVGVSGDGVDQDDMISFAGQGGFRAPDSIRSDHLGDTDLADHLVARATALATEAGLVVGPTPAGVDPDAGRRFDPDDARRKFQRGLKSVRLPFVKFPRNPLEG